MLILNYRAFAACSTTDFEFTTECVIFDLLDINLFHGWVVDPQDTVTTTAIGSKSYNQLVEWLVCCSSESLVHALGKQYTC